MKSEKTGKTLRSLSIGSTDLGPASISKTYNLEFDDRALKEFQKLDNSIREQFKKKLAERLINPRVQGDKLRQLDDCYKIKLRSSGFRLVYLVEDDTVAVVVMSVGKREGSAAYVSAWKRYRKRK